MEPNLDIIVRYAESFLGTPYVYGSKLPYVSMDCSGFVCEVLKSCGLIGYKEELSALGLYEKFKKTGNSLGISAPGQGAIFFYGVNSDSIVHCSVVVSSYTVIESGGGDSTTTSIEIAKSIGACVRERWINCRTDKFDCIMPPYPWI